MNYNKPTLTIKLLILILIHIGFISAGLQAGEALKNSEVPKKSVEIMTLKPHAPKALNFQKELKTKLEKRPHQSGISGQRNLPKDLKNLNSPNDAQIQAAIERFKKRKATREVSGNKQPTPLVRK